MKNRLKKNCNKLLQKFRFRQISALYLKKYHYLGVRYAHQ